MRKTLIYYRPNTHSTGTGILSDGGPRGRGGTTVCLHPTLLLLTTIMPRNQRDADYRRRTMCRASTEGHCRCQSCPYSHTLIDTTRLVRLVENDAPTHSSESGHVSLRVELSIGRRHLGASNPARAWRLVLDAGAHVNVTSGVRVEVEPVEVQSDMLLKALMDAERKALPHIPRVCYETCLRLWQYLTWSFP